MEIGTFSELQVDVVRSIELQPHRNPGGARAWPRPSEGGGTRGYGDKGIVSHRRNGSADLRRN